MAEEHMRFDVSALDRASRVFLALAERVERLDDKLDELDRNRVNVDVDVDTAKARGDVEVLEHGLDKLDRKRAIIHVASRGLLAIAVGLEKLDRRLDHLDGRRVEVEVDVDADSAGRKLNVFSNLMSTFMRKTRLDIIKTGLSMDSFARTFVGKFRRGITVGILGIIASLVVLPPLSVLIAGAMVLAFGGALAAIGLAVAATSKKVKNAFSDMAKHVTNVMKRITRPFIDTLLTIAKVAEKTFDALAPAMEKSFKLMAPVLSRFSRQFGRAFAELGRAFVPITRAFNALLREIGPRLVPLFHEIADALIRMARWVRRNKEDVAELLFFLLHLIPKVIDLIRILAGVWVKVKNAIHDAFTGGSQVINEFKKTFGPIIRDVARMVRRHWGPLKEWVRENFGTIREIIINILRIIRRAWRLWGEDIMRIVRLVFRALGDIIGGQLRIIRGITKVILGLLRGDWRQVWSGIKDIVLGILQVIRGAVRLVFGVMREIIVGVMHTVRSAVIGGWKAIRSGVSSAVSAIRSAVSSAFNAIQAKLSAFAHSGPVQAVIGAFNSIRSAVQSLTSAIGGLIDKINSIPDIDLPDLPNLPALPGPFGRAAGGPVTAGMPYRVGERGEELFVPSMSGTIVPNRDLPRGGINVERVEVKALGPRFDLKQVLDSLAWRMAS